MGLQPHILGQFLSVPTNIRLGLKCLGDKLLLMNVIKTLSLFTLYSTGLQTRNFTKLFLANLGYVPIRTHKYQTRIKMASKIFVLITVVKKSYSMGLQTRNFTKLFLANLGQFLSIPTNIRLGLKCLGDKLLLMTVVKILLHWPPNAKLYTKFYPSHKYQTRIEVAGREISIDNHR